MLILIGSLFGAAYFGYQGTPAYSVALWAFMCSFWFMYEKREFVKLAKEKAYGGGNFSIAAKFTAILLFTSVFTMLLLVQYTLYYAVRWGMQEKIDNRGSLIQPTPPTQLKSVRNPGEYMTVEDFNASPRKKIPTETPAMAQHNRRMQEFGFDTFGQQNPSTEKAIMTSANSQASGLWVSEKDGFGANFPSAPRKISVATSQSSGYAYQSAQEFTNGLVLYAISVVPMPSDTTKEMQKTFLENSNAGFVKTMGQSPEAAITTWTKFGDGRDQLNYEFEYDVQGVPLMKTNGFWLMDNNRTIRVSISYTKGLSPHDRNTATSFLDSFIILTKRGDVSQPVKNH